MYTYQEEISSYESFSIKLYLYAFSAEDLVSKLITNMKRNGGIFVADECTISTEAEVRELLLNNLRTGEVRFQRVKILDTYMDLTLKMESENCYMFFVKIPKSHIWVKYVDNYLEGYYADIERYLKYFIRFCSDITLTNIHFTAPDEVVKHEISDKMTGCRQFNKPKVNALTSAYYSVYRNFKYDTIPMDDTIKTVSAGLMNGWKICWDRGFNFSLEMGSFEHRLLAYRFFDDVLTLYADIKGTKVKICMSKADDGLRSIISVELHESDPTRLDAHINIAFCVKVLTKLCISTSIRRIWVDNA